jgi:hypothetical protein
MNVWVAADLDASIPPALAARGVVPESDPTLLALAPALAASVTAHDAAAWFERVYASPFDDDLRRVLADRLLAMGDERGELINLQLSTEPKTKNATRREKELTDRFGRRWLGALDPVILKTGVGFARGFLDSCHLKAKSKPALEKVIGAAEWSTVRSITEESMSWTLSPLVTKLFLTGLERRRAHVPVPRLPHHARAPHPRHSHPPPRRLAQEGPPRSEGPAHGRTARGARAAPRGARDPRGADRGVGVGDAAWAAVEAAWGERATQRRAWSGRASPFLCVPLASRFKRADCAGLRE